MKIKSTKVAYECPIFKIEEREVITESGAERTFFVMVRPPNVEVIGLTRDKKIILAKEILKEKECLVFPGGKVETYNFSEEDVKQQALQELREESGFTTTNIELLQIEQSPWNTLDREFYKYIAWDCEEVGQQLEAGESITPYLVSVEEAERIIRERELTSADGERALEKALNTFKDKGLL